MAKKRTPHLRLKKLRKIIGFTQAKLAEKCGVSYPYLLSVETGQRTISEKLARRVSFATGAPMEWLMYAPGTSETPRDYFGREYDNKAWQNYCRWDGNRFPQADFGDVGDELLLSDEAIEQLDLALRSAWRSGKFNVAVMMVRDLVRSMAEDLKLTDIMRDERKHDVPTGLFEADLKNQLPYLNSLHMVLSHISPYGRYRWGRAFEDGGKKREAFISEIEDLHNMIIDSFSLNPDGSKQKLEGK